MRCATHIIWAGCYWPNCWQQGFGDIQPVPFWRHQYTQLHLSQLSVSFSVSFCGRHFSAKLCWQEGRFLLGWLCPDKQYPSDNTRRQVQISAKGQSCMGKSLQKEEISMHHLSNCPPELLQKSFWFYVSARQEMLCPLPGEAPELLALKRAITEQILIDNNSTTLPTLVSCSHSPLLFEFHLWTLKPRDWNKQDSFWSMRGVGLSWLGWDGDWSRDFSQA